MRRVLLVVFLLALAASAEDAPKMPWNPWEKAQAGDWESFAVEVKWLGTPPKDKHGWPERVTYRLAEVDEKEVKVVVETVPAAASEAVKRVHSRAEAPTIADFFHVKGTIEDVKIVDEKRTFLEKELACKKITYTATAKATGSRVPTTVWLSKDVRGVNVAETVLEIPAPGEAKGMKVTYRLTGCGSKAKVDLGKKPEEAGK